MHTTITSLRTEFKGFLSFSRFFAFQWCSSVTSESVYKLEYKFRFRGLWRKFHDTNLAIGLVVTGFDVKSTTVKKSLFFGKCFLLCQITKFNEGVYCWCNFCSSVCFWRCLKRTNTVISNWDIRLTFKFSCCLHHHFALVFRLVCTKFPVTVYKLPLCCTYLLAIWREFFCSPCCIRSERQKYLGSLMRQFAIISESIALLSMTKISFYLYVIMYHVMAFDM